LDYDAIPDMEGKRKWSGRGGEESREAFEGGLASGGAKTSIGVVATKLSAVRTEQYGVAGTQNKDLIGERLYLRKGSRKVLARILS